MKPRPHLKEATLFTKQGRALWLLVIGLPSGVSGNLGGYSRHPLAWTLQTLLLVTGLPSAWAWVTLGLSFGASSRPQVPGCHCAQRPRPQEGGNLFHLPLPNRELKALSSVIFQIITFVQHTM